MLKDKFAKLESKSPNRIIPVDIDSVGEQLDRLKKFANTKEDKPRTAPSLSAAIQPAPRQATRPLVKQDILHMARLAGRNRGIQNTLVRVAESANAPSILTDLANEARSEVRMAVADNVHTPCYVKAALALDKDADIRFALAENHSTPLEVLQSLQEDANPYVAGRAKATLERLKMRHLLKGQFLSPVKLLRKQA